MMQKDIILSIETSGDCCSAALSAGGESFDSRFIDTPRMQSSHLAPMIEELLAANSLTVKDCAAVAVSSGPGSYTGLRVGVSLAKGLCFGAGIPLIAVGTLNLIARQALEATSDNIPDYVVPMIDARRMEVYQTVLGSTLGKTESPVEPLILDESSYSTLLDRGTVLFCGDGCAKFSKIISHPNAKFYPCNPNARYMAPLAYRKLQEEKFEDTAYMEPFYLKDFAIGVSKKKILG